MNSVRAADSRSAAIRNAGSVMRSFGSTAIYAQHKTRSVDHSWTMGYSAEELSLVITECHERAVTL